jgi:hypothetical protein
MKGTSAHRLNHWHTQENRGQAFFSYSSKVKEPLGHQLNLATYWSPSLRGGVGTAILFYQLPPVLILPLLVGGEHFVLSFPLLCPPLKFQMVTLLRKIWGWWWWWGHTRNRTHKKKESINTKYSLLLVSVTPGERLASGVQSQRAEGEKGGHEEWRDWKKEGRHT